MKSLVIAGLLLGLERLAVAQFATCVGVVTVTVTPTSISSNISPTSPAQSIFSSTSSSSLLLNSSSSSTAASASSTFTVLPECTPPSTAPSCPGNTNDTALTSGQFYRVVCDGQYVASSLIGVTIHPASYSLAQCVQECVDYNGNPNPQFGACTMVVLVPMWSSMMEEMQGMPADQKQCLLAGGQVTSRFDRAPGFENGVLLSNMTALSLACGFTEGQIGWKL